VRLVDEKHAVSARFGLVNVPSAVWIDEKGIVRRIDEGTYATTHDLNGFEFGRTDYAPMVADWVENGEASEWVGSPPDLAPTTAEQDRAEPAFQMGVYFHESGNEAKADQYWSLAQRLNPDSWNYHRQDWSFTPEEAGTNWQKKVQTLGDKPYYRPVKGLDSSD
jgi:hypothetical protein